MGVRLAAGRVEWSAGSGAGLAVMAGRYQYTGWLAAPRLKCLTSPHSRLPSAVARIPSLVCLVLNHVR